MLNALATCRFWLRQNGVIKTQTVSLFRHSLACLKKVTFNANSDVRNLSIFNRLRRLSEAAGGTGKYPGLAKPLSTWTRSKSRAKPRSVWVPLFGPFFCPFLVLIQTEESLLVVNVGPLAPARSWLRSRFPSRL